MKKVGKCFYGVIEEGGNVRRYRSTSAGWFGIVFAGMALIALFTMLADPRSLGWLIVLVVLFGLLGLGFLTVRPIVEVDFEAKSVRSLRWGKAKKLSLTEIEGLDAQFKEIDADWKTYSLGVRTKSGSRVELARFATGEATAAEAELLSAKLGIPFLRPAKKGSSPETGS